MLMILLLLPSILTGCQSTKIELDRNFIKTQLNLMPELPELPEFPSVRIEAVDGKQVMTSEDAVKIINYVENQLADYKWEIERYKENVSIVLDPLMVKDITQP